MNNESLLKTITLSLLGIEDTLKSIADSLSKDNPPLPQPWFVGHIPHIKDFPVVSQETIDTENAKVEKLLNEIFDSFNKVTPEMAKAVIKAHTGNIPAAPSCYWAWIAEASTEYLKEK